LEWEFDPAKFDLKTFRSTFASRTLRAGFDVRTVQHWMGHKSLETTMRYLVPSREVHARLDEVTVPGIDDVEPQKRSPQENLRGKAEALAARCEASGERGPIRTPDRSVSAKVNRVAKKFKPWL